MVRVLLDRLQPRPHHVPKAWADKYKRRFDEGWDRLREETLERQKRLGVVFQPSGVTPQAHQADFSLWHNMLREYSEEFLGNFEHETSVSELIDYEGAEPFRTLNQARRGASCARGASGSALTR